MKRIVKPLIGIGVGVVAGMLVLLLRGEKTRHFMSERWQQLRSALPEPERVKQSAQRGAARLAQTTGGVKDTAQQALKKVRRTGSDVKDLALKRGSTVQQAGQDIVEKARELVKQR